MTNSTAAPGSTSERWRTLFAQIADTLVLAIVVALPWSISVSTVLSVFWITAFLLSPYVRNVTEELKTWPGALPVILWAAALAGMLWNTDASWAERFKGLDDFNRLLAIPLLLAQFRASPHGRIVLIGFFISCVALLLLSYAMYFLPSLTWRFARSPGVPVKDYIAQAGEFVLCAFGLLAVANSKRTEGNYKLAIALTALAIAFVLNVTYVAASRTSIVTIGALLVWFAFRNSSPRYGLLTVLAGGAIMGATWTTSPYLQNRLTTLLEEVQAYHPAEKTDASAAMRLEFWRRSILSIREAPVLGHGTGSIRKEFARTAVGKEELTAAVTNNPHNQILAVAIQLGFVGSAILILMWSAHVWMFRQSDLTSLIGSIVVVQNIVSGLFNSHLFDFTQASLYVIGVGVIGGMVKGARLRASTASA